MNRIPAVCLRASFSGLLLYANRAFLASHAVMWRVEVCGSSQDSDCVIYNDNINEDTLE
jgi:hypothetical protein